MVRGTLSQALLHLSGSYQPVYRLDDATVHVKSTDWGFKTFKENYQTNIF